MTKWALGNTGREERFIPALIAFLGYNPLPEAGSPSEKVRRARLTRGLTIRALAGLAGVDEASGSRLEEGNPKVSPSGAAKVSMALSM